MLPHQKFKGFFYFNQRHASKVSFSILFFSFLQLVTNEVSFNMSVNLSNSFIHPPLSSRCYTLFLKFSSLWLTFVFYWFSILPFCDPLLVHLFSQWLLQHSPNKGNKFLCGIIYNYTIDFLKFTKFSERDKENLYSLNLNKNFSLKWASYFYFPPFTPFTLYFLM